MSDSNDGTGTKGVFIPIKRESPQGRQHLHTMQAGAWLPFAQASMSGLIVGIVCLTLAFVWRARNPWNWGLVPGVLTWGFAWIALQQHWFSLTALEEVTGLDLNRDGVIGNGSRQVKVEDSPRVIKVHLDEVRGNGHFHQRRFEIHATDEQMRALAEGLLEQGRPFTVREWCGAGRPFSGDQFTALRGEMLRQELLAMASDKDVRRGFILTEAGRAVLNDFLTNPEEI